MNKGQWVWPMDPRAQRRVLKRVAENPHLVQAMTAIGKAKDGLSNSELDDAVGDNSEWMTLWVIRQLTSLGFLEFKVDLFGEAAKYKLTDLGRTALSTITGQPLPAPPKPATLAAPATPAAQVAPPPKAT